MNTNSLFYLKRRDPKHGNNLLNKKRDNVQYPADV